MLSVPYQAVEHSSRATNAALDEKWDAHFVNRHSHAGTAAHWSSSGYGPESVVKHSTSDPSYKTG